MRSGLIKGGSSPTHEVDDADDLAAQAAERALTRVDDAVEAKERGKKEREEKVIQAERAAERGRTKTQKAARRYFMFRSRSRSASPVARCVEINCNALHAIDAMLLVYLRTGR